MVFAPGIAGRSRHLPAARAAADAAQGPAKCGCRLADGEEQQFYVGGGALEVQPQQGHGARRHRAARQGSRRGRGARRQAARRRGACRTESDASHSPKRWPNSRAPSPQLKMHRAAAQDPRADRWNPIDRRLPIRACRRPRRRRACSQLLPHNLRNGLALLVLRRRWPPQLRRQLRPGRSAARRQPRPVGAARLACTRRVTCRSRSTACSAGPAILLLGLFACALLARVQTPRRRHPRAPGAGPRGRAVRAWRPSGWLMDLAAVCQRARSPPRSPALIYLALPRGARPGRSLTAPLRLGAGAGRCSC